MHLSRLDHVHNKLCTACHLLSNRKATVNNRLYSVYLHVHCLTAVDFPEGDLRKRWQGIWVRLTAHPEPYRTGVEMMGDVRYTLSIMKGDEARQVEADIIKLRGLLEAMISEKRFGATVR